jgi:hypothetical protein
MTSENVLKLRDSLLALFRYDTHHDSKTGPLENFSDREVELHRSALYGWWTSVEGEEDETALAEVEDAIVLASRDLTDLYDLYQFISWCQTRMGFAY